MTQIDHILVKPKVPVQKVLVSLLGIVLIALGLASCSTYTESRKGTWHTLQAGETLELLSRRYSVPISDIKQSNDIYDPEDLAPGNRLFIPTPALIRPDPLPANNKPKPKAKSTPTNRQGTAKFEWPSQGTISSGFGIRHGKMHEGIDITKDKGRDIRAAGSGIVEFAGYRKGYGRTVIINHGGNYKTLYAHNQKLYVKKGMRVKTGVLISQMGSSGKSSGIHLHFEVRYKGKPQNPLRFLPVR